ncbi:MAG: histidine phosphatase family protein [Candidatus Falkowbacteria bacterium]|nr:MAG: histidine phosphatase family protein [Candidatus Falkowbacteria bacterium]
MKLIFIRHGKTTGDVEDRYGGDYDDHLTDKGRTQAQEALEELKTKNIRLIISSPLLRARETAEILAAGRCPVIVEPNFKERNQYGIVTGRIKEEVAMETPELAEALRDYLNTIEGAESYQDFRNRIVSAVNNLADKEQDICRAIIWHGGPMRVLFRDILKIGEIGKIGDLAWVEIEGDGKNFKIIDCRRI